VVQEIEMQNSQEWKAQYFSAERGQSCGTAKALVARVAGTNEQEWSSSMQMRRLACIEDPAGPKGQSSLRGRLH